jgi:hypothetical protein
MPIFVAEYSDEFFEIPQGLRKGSKLSPLLFNLAVNDMWKYFQTAPHGPLGVTMITSLCEEYAGVWQYADDVALVASSPPELQRMLDCLQQYCSGKGLTINLQKTKIVEFPTSAQPAGTYQATAPEGHHVPIHTVHSFPYLGVPLDAELSMTAAVASAQGAFLGAHHYARRLSMTAAGLDLHKRLMLWKTYVGAQLAHKLPFLTATQVQGLQANVNRSLQLTFGPTSSPTALHIELHLPPLHLTQAAAIAKLYRRLQLADSNFQFGAIHTILMAEPRHTHKMSKGQKTALITLHLKHHFPYIQKRDLPAPTQRADQHALLNPLCPQSTLAPYRHAWNLLVTSSTKTVTKREFVTWMQSPQHHGKTYAELIPGIDNHCIGLSKPSWTSLGLLPRNNSKLLQIRTMAVDLMRHSRLLNTTQ